MAILRNPNKGNFTVIANKALSDSNLSLKARGLLATMLSLPDNWKFSENGLCSILPKDGQASIRSGIKELKEAGYLKQDQQRDNAGKLTGVIWTISDKPHLENPHFENPSVVNPNLENQPLLNNNIYNTNKTNTKEEKNKERVYARKRATQSRSSPPSLEEISAYCRERGNTVDPEAFRDYYQARGWKYGQGKPVVDWKAAVRTWEKRERERDDQKHDPFRNLPNSSRESFPHLPSATDDCWDEYGRPI